MPEFMISLLGMSYSCEAVFNMMCVCSSSIVMCIILFHVCTHNVGWRELEVAIKSLKDYLFAECIWKLLNRKDENYSKFMTNGKYYILIVCKIINNWLPYQENLLLNIP
jgi:hypothetical protein